MQRNISNSNAVENGPCTNLRRKCRAVAPTPVVSIPSESITTIVNQFNPPTPPIESNVLAPSTSCDFNFERTSKMPPRQKRGGITFLSGDPMKIGLIGKKGGLSTVVRALQQKKLTKKQNVGTLEKSRLDWQAFKKVEGIEEELQTQIKSKTGYLERQDFLQRTDLREFEIEKELRAKRRRLTEN